MDVRSSAELLTPYPIVDVARPDADERDTEPIAERRPIHAEHREREQDKFTSEKMLNQDHPHIQGALSASTLTTNAVDARRRPA